MRIIGGRDYYDGGVAYGMDDGILFLRTGEREMAEADLLSRLHLAKPTMAATIRVKNDHKGSRYHLFQAENGLAHDRGHAFQTQKLSYAIGNCYAIVCGRLHAGMVVATMRRSGLRPHPLEGQGVHWTIQSFSDLVERHGLELVVHRNTGRHRVWDNAHEIDRKAPEDYFGVHDLTEQTRKALIAERITIATHDPRTTGDHGRHWKIDQPTLGAMEFAKAMDPVTAFQEIAMWKGGVIGADAPGMVEITDDKVKIAKHGFDVRSSFRNMK